MRAFISLNKSIVNTVNELAEIHPDGHDPLFFFLPLITINLVGDHHFNPIKQELQMKATILFNRALSGVLKDTLDILRDNDNEDRKKQYTLLESLYNAELSNGVKTYTGDRCEVSFALSGNKGAILISGIRALLNEGDMSEYMEIVKVLCEFNKHTMPLYKTMTPELLPYETINSYCERTWTDRDQFNETIRFRYEYVGRMLSALFKIIDGDTHESIMREFIHCYRYTDGVFSASEHGCYISNNDVDNLLLTGRVTRNVISSNAHICHKVLDYLNR